MLHYCFLDHFACKRSIRKGEVFKKERWCLATTFSIALPTKSMWKEETLAVHDPRLGFEG